MESKIYANKLPDVEFDKMLDVQITDSAIGDTAIESEFREWKINFSFDKNLLKDDYFGDDYFLDYITDDICTVADLPSNIRKFLIGEGIVQFSRVKIEDKKIEGDKITLFIAVED